MTRLRVMMALGRMHWRIGKVFLIFRHIDTRLRCLDFRFLDSFSRFKDVFLAISFRVADWEIRCVVSSTHVYDTRSVNSRINEEMLLYFTLRAAFSRTITLGGIHVPSEENQTSTTPHTKSSNSKPIVNPHIVQTLIAKPS
jgi:hypothetical protein